MISVLTPTYNRAYTLTRLYTSLINQSAKSFEWVVIDDGSIDDTEKLIKEFQKQNLIRIFYFYQTNTGKSQAINAGVQLCEGNHILIVDSDDILTYDAISCVEDSLNQADKDLKKISGVAFRKAYLDKTIIGISFNEASDSICYLPATDAGHLFKGDLAYCFKKEILMQHPFPHFHNEKFVPELYIWNKITDHALVKFHKNKAVYLCEYLEDGLSLNFKSQLLANPKGFGIYYKDQFKRETSYIRKMKMLIRYFQCKLYELRK
ncbi:MULTISPECIES: glycosyltransferase family A protein [Citrobacter]|uniref:glycosyltransferase family 2 protein n=1 Tax=Citrobacter TaxID=544 RepID=UPI0005A94679|nr:MULTISPECIES: glycosyltransferase family A protein [Citrobacter]KSY30958.1 glycosyl transferase family A [Citrobacter sp. 50677481]